ncbi:uncharacterized protein LAJ45_05330 [Morchella importuna]|uniref:uncharacterized protein n=1 Tax=Morchella importuna TaxID=1174673 RepID=UPI001E8D85AD|nr:uncharacterized protein LAJ45_05330 [Morchella importuna]KAH8150634.1 hypothetical protein LAJ45_05330 [Morchella importuna]
MQIYVPGLNKAARKKLKRSIYICISNSNSPNRKYLYPSSNKVSRVPPPSPNTSPVRPGSLSPRQDTQK